jgi:asparagine synthase (glutamine-hydrolysing)
MCGIAAVFETDRRAAPLDLNAMAHRGPDGRGEWMSPDGRIWFGHTRLSILDLSPAGAQPMLDAETGNVIIFNGEIYNHQSLRDEMRDAGVKWKGTSDTETLLAGYRVWGEELPDRLRGMFAFIIFDKRRNCLFVCRGPVGIKPLYYGKFGGGLRFASEVRTLMGAFPRKCSRSGLSSYLQWGSCPESDFIFSGVEMLPAGSSMIVNADGTTAVRRYWPALSYRRVSADAAPLEVRKLLERSVEEHLLSDVPVASFLSGGIDSSIVTAIAARAMGKRRLRTFSVGFPYQEFDETSVAAEVARRYGTDHHRIEVADDEAIVLVKEAVEKMDAPSVDAINTYIVSRKVAQQGIKVALSGLGADELFGGYPSFRDAGKLRLLSAVPKSIRKCFSGFGSLGARLADLPSGDLTAMAIWRRRLWSDEMLHEAGLPVVPLQLEAPPELPDGFARISWAELSVYMRQMLLRDSDQMSMAASLELRVPFLDRELVEYVLRLPAHEKTRHPGTKGLLVQACRDLLPKSVYNRPKMGFTLPMDVWMRGPLQKFSDAGFAEVERLTLIAPEAIAHLRRQFLDGKIHWTRIWSLVVLGHYLKRVQVSVGFEGAAELAHA